MHYIDCRPNTLITINPGKHLSNVDFKLENLNCRTRMLHSVIMILQSIIYMRIKNAMDGILICIRFITTTLGVISFTTVYENPPFFFSKVYGNPLLNKRFLMSSNMSCVIYTLYVVNMFYNFYFYCFCYSEMVL